ncbi:MAG: DUF805 domain-containing protein, partial [Terrimicrobiaceae bacterium]
MKLAAPNRIAAYFLPIGRIGGAAWFIRNLLNLIALGLLAALISDFKSSYTETLLGVLGFVWIYLTVITAAKRFHDLNLTGWLAPLVFVPVAPLFLLILSGTKGSNKYGIYPGTAQSERTSAITTRIIFLLAGLGLIASIIVLACTQTLKNSGSRYFSTLKPPVSDTHYGQTSKELFIKTGPRIVMLESFSASGQGILQGSGVILGPTLSGAKDGYYRLNTGTDILTNHHVVKNSDHVVITTKDGEKHLAAVIFFDEQADLALLRAPLESS